MQSKPVEKKKNKKDKKSQFFLIGSIFLIICGVGILSFKYYQIYKNNKEDENKLNDFFEQQKEIQNEDTENLEEVNFATENYIAVLDIPKIGLKRGIYSKDSALNTVDQNIELLKESDMPDQVNGNFIIAGHSGTSRVSYFKNLPKLSNGDEVYVYYNGLMYSYRLVNSYEVNKTGEADIKRDEEKTTLTLITCKHNYEIQIIYIFELV